MALGLPRVTSRTRRAWSLLSRGQRFVLVHQGVEYHVDRGGWARPLEDPKSSIIHASKLLDPAKRGLR